MKKQVARQVVKKISTAFFKLKQGYTAPTFFIYTCFINKAKGGGLREESVEKKLKREQESIRKRNKER